MKALPSQSLLDSLAELQLAQPDDVARVASRARRLARDLASFDLAWIDALQQAKLLTPWQAEQLQQGRAGQMSIGRFVLYAPLASLGWATVYRVRCRDTGEWRQLYVAVIDAAHQEHVDAGLRRLVESSRQLDARYCWPVLEAGLEGHEVAGRLRAWAVTDDVPARRAQSWLAANGRFASDQALEIARQTAAAAAHLQVHDHLHGDLATTSLLIDLEGNVRLAVPGLRLVLRRCEGFSRADLPPECYDTLAPERIEPSSPATWESEAYSLAGCWWQLLTGRAPFAGGDSLTKLRNLHRARWLDIAAYAPETDQRLISAIKQQTAIEPAERPADFLALCELLGESTPLGRRSLGQAMRPAPTPLRWRRHRSARLPRRGESFPWSTAVVVLLAVLAGVGWPVWKNYHARSNQPLAELPEFRWEVSSLGERFSPPPRLLRDQAASSTRLNATAETPFHDTRIAAAGFEQDAPLELLLASDRTNAWPAERLAAGTLVRPQRDGRATLEVPPGGIVVDVSELVFQNIDFVTEQGGDLIRLSAAQAMFRGCTFRGGTSGMEGTGSAAIRWTAADDASLSPVPGSARLAFENCHFHGLDSAILMERAADVDLDLDNTLITSCEAAVRWSRRPAAEATIRIRMAHATVRDAGRLLVFDDDAPRTAETAARLVLEVDDSVFDLGAGAAVVEIHAAVPPLRFLQQFDWSGEGSMLAGETPLVLWNDGQIARGVKESQLAVDGLARTRIQFVGENLREPAESVASDWYAPRIAADPPGIDGALLPPATDSAAGQLRQ